MKVVQDENQVGNSITVKVIYQLEDQGVKKQKNKEGAVSMDVGQHC